MSTNRHMFSHTVASRLTRDGVDIVTAKELLGRANINCTMLSDKVAAIVEHKVKLAV